MPTTIPAITALPDAPLRSDPSTFPVKAENMLVAQETVFVPELQAFVTAVNTFGGEVQDLADDAAQSAIDATTNGAAQVTLAAAQVTLATTQATNAANSATAAANSALTAGATIWVSGTTYSIGDARYSPINFQTYRRTIAGAGTTDPSLDSANWTLATASGISTVVTATTNTTLTSTKTLLQITPTSYGVTVKLPDATTCSVGGPVHCIDNRGAYPVRVVDSTDVLKGFIFAGVVSYISLDNNSTAAGVWAISNNELVGASAQLLTTSTLATVGIGACVDIGSSRELLVSGLAGSTYSNLTAVVYDRSTNTWGTPTVIRAGLVKGVAPAVLSAANQVLVVSCSNSTAFEAVTLSISGTTITVNTAATATLSANLSDFADGCGLIAVGSSFVTSYTVATPAAQIRALSISGTTVTIGSATVLDGTAGGIQHASGSVVVVASTSNAVANVFTKPYTVSGSTLSAGTGTSTAKQNSTHVLQYFAPFSSGRWMIACGSSGNGADAGIVTLSGTTTTISYLTNFYAGGQTHADAIIVGANKVLFLGNSSSSNANILTDTAGTASAGTAITLSARTTRCCINVSGTDAYVQDGDTTQLWLLKVDCSGASPVMARKIDPVTISTQTAVFAASNAVLTRSVNGVYGTDFAATVNKTNNTQITNLNVSSGVPALKTLGCAFGLTAYRGKANSERWIADAATVITKVECV